MTDLLILRPEPGATATAAAAARSGLDSEVAALFTIAPLDWAVPAGAHDALMLTSANAVRYAGAGLALLAAMPVYAVGEATATAARAAGLTVVHVGTGDAAELLAAIAAAGRRRPLHLAGADHAGVTHPALTVARATVYRAAAVPRLPATVPGTLAGGAVALVHSPRAGALFGRLLDAASMVRSGVAVAAISPAAAAALGAGWGRVSVAEVPTDAALLAVAARLCEERRGRTGRQG